MERISGMVIPFLQFDGLAAFATLVEPDAYYVVTAEHPDNSMRLSLAYRNPACARVLPPCLTFEAILCRGYGRYRNSRKHMGTTCPRSLTRTECPPNSATRRSPTAFSARVA
jgi:hypothetical protein